MGELIEIINQYGLTGLLIILVALFAGIKECYEGYMWITSKVEAWRLKKNGIEQKELTIEERIADLEAKRQLDHTALESLCESITKIGKDLCELTAEFRSDKAERDKRELDKFLTSSRNKIISIANDLRNGRTISDEAYIEVFKNYSEYEKAITEHGMTNGLVDQSIEIIKRHYAMDKDIKE